MTYRSPQKKLLSIGLVCLILFVFLAYLFIDIGGSQSITLNFYKNPENFKKIILHLRLPRALTAIIIGASLAAAGVISQGIFRNVIAGPTILGTASGAVLSSSLALFFFQRPNVWAMPTSGIIGSILSTLAIIALNRRGKLEALYDSKLILYGFALNILLGSMNSLILALSLQDPSKSLLLIHRMMGSLSGSNWDYLIAMTPLLGIGIFIAHRISYQLNVLNLGHDIANSLGLSWRKLSFWAILSLSLLVGTSTGFVGLTPFVGILAPHVTRKLVGADNRRLLPSSMLVGSTLTLTADLFARTINYPSEIPVGVAISLIGAPWLIYLLFRNERN